MTVDLCRPYKFRVDRVVEVRALDKAPFVAVSNAYGGA